MSDPNKTHFKLSLKWNHKVQLQPAEQPADYLAWLHSKGLPLPDTTKYARAPYVAQILGTSETYGLNRSFVSYASEPFNDDYVEYIFWLYPNCVYEIQKQNPEGKPLRGFVLAQPDKTMELLTTAEVVEYAIAKDGMHESR